MNERSVIFSLWFLALLLGGSVIAAGSSTGSSSPSSSLSSKKYSTTQATEVIRAVNCESVSYLRQRIKCRMDNGVEEESSKGEEACRGLTVNLGKKCEELYEKSYRCYTLQDSDKKSCFKQESGLPSQETLKGQQKEYIRNYVILLLYELQERVEDSFHEGTINSEDASQLVEKIVLTKKAVLMGKPKAEIKVMTRDLKTKWQVTMSSKNSEAIEL